MLASLLGMRVSEHWEVDATGKRVNHHARIVQEVD